MSRALALPALLAACAVAPQPEAAPQAPPAPTMSLTATPVYPGATLTLRVTGAAPNAQLYFFRGDGPGVGPCAPDGSVCVSLVSPRFLGAARADANGESVLQAAVPSTVPFDTTHMFQALRPGPQSAASTLARVSNLEGCGGPVDLSGADLTGLDLSNVDLSCADLSDAILVGANLTSAYLYEANLDGAWLDGANLTSAVLRRASLRYASARASNVTSTEIYGSDATGLDLGSAYGAGLHFTSTNVDGMSLVDARISNLLFTSMTVLNVDATYAWLPSLTGTSFDHVDFDNAEIRPTGFGNATLTDCTFRNARMTGSVNPATLTRVDLTNADLAGMEFRNINMTDVDFTDAFLQRATLGDLYGQGGSFDGADLRNVSYFRNTSWLGLSFVGATCSDGLPASDHGNTCFY